MDSNFNSISKYKDDYNDSKKGKNNNTQNTNIPTNIVEDNRLILGTNDKKISIFIPETSRYYNSLILGTKGTGKTENVLPNMVSQDLANKKVGTTIIVTKKEMSYSMYALAKKHKRKVIFLKPSISNEICNKFLWQTNYDYDYINEFIINYKEAIKKKYVVIIDMEILKYKSEGLRAVAMLLLQLQLDIQETDITQKTPHFLYVDDAHYYLPFLEYLLSFSDSYNLGVNLFMQSRNQFKKNEKDFTLVIDNNVRTTVLLNNLTSEDVYYYSQRFYEYKNNLSNFYNRKINSFMYETLDFHNQRKNGIADFKLMDKESREDLLDKAKKARVKLLKEKRVERENQLIRAIRNNDETNGDNKSNIDNDYNYDDMGEPKPFNINDLNEEIDEQYLKEELYTEEEPNNKKIDEGKIKELIYKEEKGSKRKVSSEIFNKLNSDIDYCNDSFDFKFD